MNLRFFSVMVGSAVGLVALAACTSETGGGTGGSGTGASGGGGVTSSVSSAGGGGVGGAASTGTGGGTGGGATCQTCAAAITPPDGDPNKLCSGTSTDLYNALAECVCNGACSTACGDNACMGMDATMECQTCIQDTQAGCGKEFGDCASDA